MPLNIKITERDNSVFNTLSTWTNLVSETKTVENERSSETREVIFEKYNALTNLTRQRKETINKWKNSGFLEGLHGLNRQNIAELYEAEAQASCLLNEVNVGRTFGVSSRGFDSKPKKFFLKIKSFFVSIWNKIFKKKKVETNFDGIIFPMVRRVFAQTVALNLVSVQPLSAPTGMLFFLDKAEREDVYTRVVLVEKWKPWTGRNLSYNQDYFIPVRDNNNGHMMTLDGDGRDL